MRLWFYMLLAISLLSANTAYADATTRQLEKQYGKVTKEEAATFNAQSAVSLTDISKRLKAMPDRERSDAIKDDLKNMKEDMKFHKGEQVQKLVYLDLSVYLDLLLKLNATSEQLDEWQQLYKEKSSLTPEIMVWIIQNKTSHNSNRNY